MFKLMRRSGGPQSACTYTPVVKCEPRRAISQRLKLYEVLKRLMPRGVQGYGQACLPQRGLLRSRSPDEFRDPFLGIRGHSFVLEHFERMGVAK